MITRRSALAAALLAPAVALAQGPLPSVSVQEAQARQKAGFSVLVDIRRPEEWAETGVARGAVRLDMTAPDFLARLGALKAANPGKEIDLICRTANRTALVQAELARQGWRGLVNVRGGMAGRHPDPGWIDSRLPVEK